MARATSSTPTRSKSSPGLVSSPAWPAPRQGARWQLERVGYFVFDTVDSRPDAPVLNRIVTLRDSRLGQRRRSRRRARRQPAPTPGRRRRAESSTGPKHGSGIRHWPTASPAWPTTYGLAEGDVDLLTGDRPTGDLFEEAVGHGGPPDAMARWVINELPRELGDRPLQETPLTGGGLAALVLAVESGQITGTAAKEVFAEMVERGGDPQQIIAERGLDQVIDEAAIAGIIDEVLAANPAKVEQYRAGKTGLIGFFVGQVVRASQGKANPQVIQSLLVARLG